MQEQLLGLVYRGARVDHAPNEHDDFSNAAAGAVWAAAAAPQGWMRTGSTSGPGCGPIEWHDKEPQPLRIRRVITDRDGKVVKEVTSMMRRDPKFVGDRR